MIYILDGLTTARLTERPSWRTVSPNRSPEPTPTRLRWVVGLVAGLLVLLVLLLLELPGAVMLLRPPPRNRLLALALLLLPLISI